MYLPSLSDAELVSADTLPVIQIAEEFDIDPEALRDLCEAHPGDMADCTALLAKLSDYDIHTADQLEEQIERSRKFYDIANDAGDALARLAALAAETL